MAPFLAVGALFVVTRTVLLLFTVREREFVLPSVTNDVREIYSRWYDVLSTGSFPDHDVMWQYPPAAALVILAPGLLPFSYSTSFYWISFAVDVLTFVVLLVAARRRLVESGAAPAPAEATTERWAWARTQPWAAWVWTLGVALGGPIAYGRYDLIVTGVAVCALVLLVRADARPELDLTGARRRLWGGGGLLAFGAMLKIWPVLLLLCVGPGRRWREAWGAAVVTGTLILFGFWAGMPHALSFLNAQGGRGVEVESIAALPFHVASHHGWDGYVALNYGSMEYLGPHVNLAAKLCLIASALAFGWLVFWRLTARTWHDATTADAALVGVLLFVVTSRVISPQYMVWMVGLGAVCALHFGPRGGSVMRLPVVLVLIATALSCVEYPYWFDELLNAERGAVLLVTVRNVLLLGAAVIGASRLWRSTRAPAGAQGLAGGLRVLVAQAGSRSRSQEMSAP
ncbi:glycosyltransferase family 87 protein [Sporichthya sp.]|uniref:glycosyltransferase family 87 protein n=1 Tax=Sporichthya sp. TaxID=65475 RepID=UPI0025D4EF15|nr:glycosyltransferase family 87 protein [Sporichthya sp.]